MKVNDLLRAAYAQDRAFTDFAESVQGVDRDRVMTFMRKTWEPIFTALIDSTHGADPSTNIPRELAKQVQNVILGDVYREARRQWIPASSWVFAHDPIRSDLNAAANPASSEWAAKHVASMGASHDGGRNPLERQIDHETDRRFWAETGYKVGRPLNRKIPRDAQMIPTWLDIRYQVAQQVAAGQSPAQLRAFDADDADMFAARPSPGPGPGSSSAHPYVTITAEQEENAMSRQDFDHMSSGDVFVGRGGGGGGRGRQGQAQSYGNQSVQMITLPTQPDQSLVEIAPVVAAGTAPNARWTCNLQFNPETYMLTAAVSIDGRMYSGAADLHMLIDDIGGAIAQSNYDLHGDANAPIAHAQVRGQVDQAIRSAGDILVGAAIERHRTVTCAGWWHDLSKKVHGAVHSVEHGVESAAKGVVGTVGHTLSALKGPIAIAASAAAGAAALAIPGVGPFVAPMAAGLAKDLVTAATGSGSAKQAAQNAVNTAKAQALNDPHVAAALDIAHQKVAQATAAYHTAQTVANAAAGDPNAQAQVAQLTTAAAQGDADAQALVNVASDLTDAAAANQVVSQGVADVRVAASRLAQNYQAGGFSPVIGILIAKNAKQTPGAYQGHGPRHEGVYFANLDNASDWLAEQENRPHLYAAIYDANDPTWPEAIEESAGHELPEHIANAVSSGVLPFLAGAGLGSIGTMYAQVKHAEYQRNHHPENAPAASSGALPFLVFGGAGLAAGAYFWPAMRIKLEEKFPRLFAHKA